MKRLDLGSIGDYNVRLFLSFGTLACGFVLMRGKRWQLEVYTPFICLEVSPW